MKWSSVNSYKAKITLLISVFLIIILTATLIPACKAGPSSVSPTTTPSQGGTYEGGIKLTCVSGWSEPWNGNTKLHEFIARINKEGKGKVFINYLGGAEVAPLTETGGLVRDGVFDMALVAPAYFAGLCPPAVMSHFAPPDPVLRRQIGVTAMLDKFLRQRMGCTSPGQLWVGESFGIMSRKPITSATFNGMLIHTLPILTAGLTYLGASTVSLTTAEFYVALERGVVDAVPLPWGSVPYDLRLYEVATYLLNPLLPVYTSGPLLINLKRWDSLPADVQKLITDTIIDMEPGVYKYYVDSMNDYAAKMVKAGLQITNLSSEDAKRYNYAFTTFAWQDMIRTNGDDGKAFFELLKPYFDWAKTAPPY
jgi:TRAP-type C4-dicarboxylate transport system substrate-binding protein